MLIIDNIPVMTSVPQIISTLQRELHLAGIPLLKDVAHPKFDGQDLMVTCPYHKHGQENKPSCGITTRQKKRGEKIIPAGTVHCFVCHETRTIEQFISDCFEQDRDFGKRWILNRFNNFEVESRTGFFRIPQRNKAVEKVQYVTKEELSKYRFYHPYMYKRFLTTEQIDYFDIGVDIEDASITFPVKDTRGNVLFIARRSIKGKRFHIPSTVKDKPICYLYESQKLYPNSRVLYICESMFNALTLLRFVPAVALLGTGTHNQIETLKTLPYRRYVLCLDNDKAGQRATEKMTYELANYKLLSAMIPKDTTKDINDLGYTSSMSELKDLCYVYSPCYIQKRA